MGVALVAGFRESVARAATSKSGSSTPLPIPNYNKGTVDGQTYKNSSVGLEFIVPPGFQFKSPQLTGPRGKAPVLVTVMALGVERVSFFLSFRDTITFMSEARADLPDPTAPTATEDYFAGLIHVNEKEGFMPQQGDEVRTKWGGVYFSRVDFRRRPAYEAVLVKACHNQVLTFIFAGLDLKSVDRLIAGTKLNINMTLSHCVPNEERKFIPFRFGPGGVSLNP